ncbi:MAG: PQQ-binding-like beta-propeller repeat protein [Dongiaceae bacterium]
MTMLRLAPLALALAVAGCDGFLGASEGPPLPGERKAVLQLDSELTADPALAALPVILPLPYHNPDWAQAGGVPSHAVQHLALPQALTAAWVADVGRQGGDSQWLLTEPVVADGRVYAMDAGATVSAFDAAGGKRLWRVDLTPREERGGLFGGGLAFADGRLYATTPFARVFALDAATGAEAWQSPAPAPARASPTFSDGRLFVLTVDNQLVAYDAGDGRRLWSHAGISESAGLLGGAAPAVAANTVVAPYSSGELFALRAETGRVLWSDNLAGVARAGAIATLADIRGRPVIDGDLVVAVSHSGIVAAIDLRSGARTWDANVGGTESPWLAGEFIFLISNNAELLCLTRRDGRIRWVRPLPRFEDEEKRQRPIYWTGPALAGDRLIVAGSNGEALFVAPQSGEIVGNLKLPGGAHLPPVVAGSTLYFLTDNAKLIAFR